MTDRDIDDVMDPLFVDRFVAKMARSLFRVPPPERRDWLSFFLRGVETRIWGNIHDTETKHLLEECQLHQLDNELPPFINGGSV
jgi:hypothetical protein